MGNCYSSNNDEKASVDIKDRKQARAGKKPKNFAHSFSEKEMADDIGEALWDDYSDLKDDGELDEESFKDDEVTVKRHGETKQLFKASVAKNLRTHLAAKVKSKHKQLGGFEFRMSDITSLKLEKSKLETRDTTECEDEAHYVGQWNSTNDDRQGRGIAIYSDGSLYEGFWIKNRREGAGRLITKRGDVLQGRWEQDKMSGYGVSIISDLKQKGFWLRGVLDGDGYEIDGEGNAYRGDFKMGIKEGNGTFVYTDGSIYTGEIANGQTHGQGRLVCDFDTYEGGFKDGKRNGKGKCTFKKGDCYEGDYRMGIKEGKGKYSYAAGGFYDGDWKNNKQHGEALAENAKGKQFKCIYKEGKFEKVYGK